MRNATIEVPTFPPFFTGEGWSVYHIYRKYGSPLWVDVRLVHTAALKQRPKRGVRRTRRLSWGIHEQRFANSKVYHLMKEMYPDLIARLTEACRAEYKIEAVAKQIGTVALEAERVRLAESKAKRLAREAGRARRRAAGFQPGDEQEAAENSQQGNVKA